MPVGRYARHTKKPGTTTIRQELREKVIYAADMTIGNDVTAANLGASPVYQFDPDADQWAIADLKVPKDRVPGTPIRLRFVFAITTNPFGDVAWYISYLVAGEGTDLTGALSLMWEIVAAAGVNLQMTTDGLPIVAADIDPFQIAGKSVDIQMRIGRDGADALDTATGIANLMKVIAEYTAYN